MSDDTVFVDDTGLADRYFESIQSTELEPEKSLMLAVLEDDVECFQKHLFAKTGKARALFQDAENWILDDSEDQIFSFNTICETLGIGSDWLRRSLMEWKRRKLEERSRYRPAA